MKNPLPKQEYNLVDLYRTILEFGSECISCGVCYSDFKQVLIQRGFVAINQETNEPLPEMEEYIEYWFLENFLHADRSCSFPEEHFHTCDEPKKKNHIENCTFFMAQTSCMNLLAFKEAQLNKQASSKNLNVAKISAVIAFVAVVYGFKDFFTGKDIEKALPVTVANVDTLKLLQQKAINRYDSLSLKLDTMNNTLHMSYVYDTTYHVEDKKGSISSLKKKSQEF